jgi:Ca-activated chloride channel family protein
VSISSPTDEKGYIFSITLNPVHAELIERMSQNFYFIIDASASIDRQKFSLYKRSVLKALSALQEGDRFNIIVLDKKLTRLSQRNLIFNLKSVHMAEDFLEKLNQANFITSVDLLESLEKLSEAIEDSPQMHTALLLTNGQSSEGFQGQQSRIKSFIEKNNGKIALYAAAVGGKNNLVTLDMLCNISGGKMLYSDTNAAFPRKLTNLVKSLKAPLAKDIRITAAAINNKAGLTLLTTKQTLPAIYAGEPYTIVGTMERLCDIHLTIEARHDDEWVTIEKEISFDSAKLDTSLAVEWKKAQLTAHYQNFLKEPKIKHLKNARELLQLEHGKVAVE